MALIGVRFELTDQNLHTTQILEYINNLDPLLPANHLRPGQSRFVAILRPFTDAVVHNGLSALAAQPTYQDGLAVVNNLAKLKTITASIDAVAFDNGDFVGPDTGQEFLRLTQSLSAEQYVCDQVTGSLQGGAETLKGKLLELLSVQERPRTDLLHWDVYTRRQVSVASNLSRLLDQGGVALVQRRLDQFKVTSTAVRLTKLE